MECLESRIRYRGHSLDLRLTHDALTVSGESMNVAPIALSVAGKIYDYVSGTTRVFELNDGGVKPAPSQKG